MALPLSDLDTAILDAIERLLAVARESEDTRTAAAAAATYRNARTVTGRDRHAARIERALRREFEHWEASDDASYDMGGPQEGGWEQNLMYGALMAAEHLCADGFPSSSGGTPSATSPKNWTGTSPRSSGPHHRERTVSELPTPGPMRRLPSPAPCTCASRAVSRS